MSTRAFLRASLAGLATLTVGGLSTAVPQAAAKSQPAVAIGNVKIAVEANANSDAAPELGRALRAVLKDELSHIDGLRLGTRPLIVSATLTRLSSEQRNERATASAAISLALTRADDRVLLAELRGRASVEESAGNMGALRRAAVQGAVRGALARLPEAVQRSR